MAKKQIEPGPFIVPMPLVLVGAAIEGKANFMPAAFVGIVNFKPATIVCGLNPEHRTSQMIEQTGAFSINIPTPSMVEVTDHCGLVSGTKFDKSCVFPTFTGRETVAPMIRDCPLTAECKLINSVALGGDTAYFGEIVAVYAEQDVLTDDQVDWLRINPLLFTFPKPSYWRLGEYIAPAWQVGKKYKGE